MSFLRLVMSAALAGGIARAAPLAVACEPVRGAVAPVVVDSVDVGASKSPRSARACRSTSPSSARPARSSPCGSTARAAVLELREIETRRVRRQLPHRRRRRSGPRAASRRPCRRTARSPMPRSTSRSSSPRERCRGSARRLRTRLRLRRRWWPPRRPRRLRPPSACRAATPVESVAVEVGPRGGVIGAIGGAIAGAILGKEAGEAHKQRMLTVLVIAARSRAARSATGHENRSSTTSTCAWPTARC